MNVGNIFQAYKTTIAVALNDDVFILFFCGIASRILQYILFNLWTQSAAFAQFSRRDLYILVFKSITHVIGRQAVGNHLVGMKPYAHCIIARTENIQIANAVNTQQLWRYVDVKIIKEKSLVNPGVVTVKIDIHKYIRLFT